MLYKAIQVATEESSRNANEMVAGATRGRRVQARLRVSIDCGPEDCGACYGCMTIALVPRDK